jgi:hypothetical protein
MKWSLPINLRISADSRCGHEAASKEIVVAETILETVEEFLIGAKPKKKAKKAKKAKKKTKAKKTAKKKTAQKTKTKKAKKSKKTKKR